MNVVQIIENCKDFLQTYRSIDMHKAVPKPPPRFLPSEKEQQLIREAIYGKKFKGLTRFQSDTVRDLLVQNMSQRGDYKDAISRLQEFIPKMGAFQANLIVRNEEHEIRSTLREAAFRLYDPEGNNLYQWIGPNDYRTTPVCKELKELTKKGVKLDELKRLIQIKAKEYNPDYDPRDWSPHFNCRHWMIRYY